MQIPEAWASQSVNPTNRMADLRWEMGDNSYNAYRPSAIAHPSLNNECP
jgi:hypothetical protein